MMQAERLMTNPVCTGPGTRGRQRGRNRSSLAGEQEPPASVLSRRERQVLGFIARGSALKEVAAALGISFKTVDQLRCNLMRKLDLHDRVLLARYAIRHALVSAAAEEDQRASRGDQPCPC